MTNIAEIKWIKLATDIFDNRKIKLIEKMPDGDSMIVIWLKLLCLAGTVNDSGLIYLTRDVPYNDEMLAAVFDRPLPTIRLALQTFERYAMLEVVNDIMMLPSWEKYQNVDGLEKVREQNRIRKAKQRETQKLLTCHVTSHDDVTESHATDKDIDKDKENISSEVGKPTPDKPIFEKDSKPYKCAEFLAKKLTERIPNKKIPETHLQTWAADFDKANRIDGHSWDDIGEVLTFSQDDSFWQINILSGAKFRKQYDQLYLKMQKES